MGTARAMAGLDGARAAALESGEDRRDGGDFRCLHAFPTRRSRYVVGLVRIVAALGLPRMGVQGFTRTVACHLEWHYRQRQEPGAERLSERAGSPLQDAPGSSRWQASAAVMVTQSKYRFRYWFLFRA